MIQSQCPLIMRILYPLIALGQQINLMAWEQPWALFADRTSTHEMRSNPLRLYFSSFAYVLMQTLRRLGLNGTSMARAQCDTIRLKRFKVGAHIRIRVRRARIAFSERYPHVDLCRQIGYKLQRIPLRC